MKRQKPDAWLIEISTTGDDWRPFEVMRSLREARVLVRTMRRNAYINLVPLYRRRKAKK
jgi:hypothetical protein